MLFSLGLENKINLTIKYLRYSSLIFNLLLASKENYNLIRNLDKVNKF